MKKILVLLGICSLNVSHNALSKDVKEDEKMEALLATKNTKYPVFGRDGSVELLDDTSDLEWAIQNGTLPLVKYLVEKRGANVNAIGRFGSPMIKIAAFCHHLEIVKYLVEKGADVNACGQDKETALMMAVYSNDLSMTKYLVEEANADINAESRLGATIFTYAEQVLPFRSPLKKYLLELQKKKNSNTELSCTQN